MIDATITGINTHSHKIGGYLSLSISADMELINFFILRIRHREKHIL